MLVRRMPEEWLEGREGKGPGCYFGGWNLIMSTLGVGQKIPDQRDFQAVRFKVHGIYKVIAVFLCWRDGDLIFAESTPQGQR